MWVHVGMCPWNARFGGGRCRTQRKHFEPRVAELHNLPAFDFISDPAMSTWAHAHMLTCPHAFASSTNCPTSRSY
jgi:hypothetical protein